MCDNENSKKKKEKGEKGDKEERIFHWRKRCEKGWGGRYLLDFNCARNWRTNRTESRKSRYGRGKVDEVEDSKVDVGVRISTACLNPFNPEDQHSLSREGITSDRTD